jgi:hypothetical protein
MALLALVSVQAADTPATDTATEEEGKEKEEEAAAEAAK